LNNPPNTTVTVEWSTRDGTAQSGLDYESDSGTLTFAPGETEQDIAIRVSPKHTDAWIADPDLHFYVDLTEPVDSVVATFFGFDPLDPWAHYWRAKQTITSKVSIFDSILTNRLPDSLSTIS